MINLKNGYRINQLNELNFSLEHYELATTAVKDSEGKVVKEENANGKMVNKTIQEHQWVHKGYYGTLKGLLKGMVNHNAMVTDCDNLEKLLNDTDKLIKSAIKELKHEKET